MDAQPRDNFLLLKSFLAGGVAGMTSKTAVAPLDRMKILLQVHNVHYKHLGVFSGLKSVVKKESIKGLYRGNGAQMVRIFPYAAMQFVSFEAYKKALIQSFGAKTVSGKPKHSLKFVAGSLAGVTAATCTYPLDFVRARLAFEVTPISSDGFKPSGSGGLSKFKIFTVIRHVISHEGGIKGLYRGLTPTLMAMVPYSGFSFYIFERLKHLALDQFPLICANKNVSSDGTIELVLNIPSKLACGAAGGAIAQIVSYPLDVTRRRMQLAMTSPETMKYGESVFRTLSLVYKEHGVSSGLYRGMSINFIRACPMVAVSFSTYELMKQWLGLETGIVSSEASKNKKDPSPTIPPNTEGITKKRDVL